MIEYEALVAARQMAAREYRKTFEQLFGHRKSALWFWAH